MSPKSCESSVWISRFSKMLSPMAFTLLVLLVWHCAVSLLSIPEYILPTPFAVAMTLVSEFALFFRESAVSFVEAIAGLLLGASLGFLSAVAFVHSRFLERAIYPYAIVLKTIPLVALAPLLTLWFGVGLLGKVIMASLLCYFPVLVNTTLGLRSVDELSLEYFRSVAASKVQCFFKLRLPTSLPYLFSALRISATMSMLGAIVAELTGANRGIGYQILAASYRLETTKLVAALVWTGAIGLVLFGVVVAIEKWLVNWEHYAD